MIHPVSWDRMCLSLLEMVIANCMRSACNAEKIGAISAWSKGIAGGRVISRLRNLPVQPGHDEFHSAVAEKLD